MKITKVDSTHYYIKNKEYNGMGRNVLNLKVGDNLKFGEFDYNLQRYKKVTVNGNDVTSRYNSAINERIEQLKSWANIRKNELINR